MGTGKQQLGEFGERLVCNRSNCPRCKRTKTLRRLPNNFKCADIICDFCGYLAQVKTSRSRVIDMVPEPPGAFRKSVWTAGYISRSSWSWFHLMSTFLAIIFPPICNLQIFSALASRCPSRHEG